MEQINSRDEAMQQLRVNTLLELRELAVKLAEVQSDIEILLTSGGLECKL